MSKDFELDFDTVNQNRKTVKENVLASKQVRGDMIYPDETTGYAIVNTKIDVEGSWDVESVKE